ncbi:MAG: IPT/TIG domain-containing protein [Dehalococcoidia bacterium]
MRWLSRLLVVLLVCLAAMALPAAPAQADGGTPSITLTPNNGVPGTSVTVRGYNFVDDELVDIYYYLNTDRTLVKIDVPSGTGNFTTIFIVPESYQGTHKVFADGENDSASSNFTVKPGLTVSPEEGPVGTNVTVTGQGFAENETGIELRYYLDGNYTTVAQNISADDYGSWNWTLPVPPSTMEVGGHKIDAQGHTSTFAQVRDAFFGVTPGIGLSELSGSPGENITVTGSGFYANDRYITILFAGEEPEPEIRVDADALGNWTKVFEVPEMPTGTNNVTAYGESTPKAAVTTLSFKIEPGLALSPDEGHVGTDLTVTGGGFPPDEDVSITYEDNQEATATTDSTGSFVANFVVPKSQHGEHQVIAADTVGNNATATFIMESKAPDTPALSSPPDRSRVGFIGKVRPTFNWSAVSDESGVYYSLQIAASANVTATGFADPIVSVAGLVGTNYILNATQALPYGTYYWIVQAVDGAENAGNWTVARSFQAGLLPLWAFIVIIIAIVAGIGTAVYFFVIRRRTYYY